MHACGHDCHTSMMLTAAHILNDMKSELCGTVKLAFQPAEEVVKGAKSMIENGALEGVDGCFGIHVVRRSCRTYQLRTWTENGISRSVYDSCHGKGRPRRKLLISALTRQWYLLPSSITCRRLSAVKLRR